MKYFFYCGMSGSPWGGSEELWSRAAIQLVKEGHQVSVLVKKWSPPSPQIIELATIGVDVHTRTDTNVFGVKLINKIGHMIGLKEVIGAQSTLRGLLKSQKPDLLIVSHGGISDGLVAMETALDMRIPYVSLIQANSESWKIDDDLSDRLLKASMEAKCNYFVATANRDLFFRQIGRNINNCDIVFNPPNPSLVQNIPWPESDIELSMACVARLDVAAKGQDILFEVLSQKQWKNRKVRLHLYGTGINTRRLKRLAEDLKIQDKVVFEGFIQDIAQVWRKHHVLVLPSRYEGTPLSLIEAMLSARPFVGTAVAGIPDLIEDGKTGFLAEAPTVKLFADCMERAWENRESLQEMGLRCYESIRKKAPSDPVGYFTDKLLTITTNK
jgi:glycosyltransferase involved in cell wall biosynthesis